MIVCSLAVSGCGSLVALLHYFAGCESFRADCLGFEGLLSYKLLTKIDAMWSSADVVFGAPLLGSAGLSIEGANARECSPVLESRGHQAL